jgi:ribosome-associated protein
MDIAGKRMNQKGEVVIEATEYRTQGRNREQAQQRLIALIRKALHKPKPRKKTAPTARSRQARLDAKRRRGDIKKLRKKAVPEQ